MINPEHEKLLPDFGSFSILERARTGAGVWEVFSASARKPEIKVTMELRPSGVKIIPTRLIDNSSVSVVRCPASARETVGADQLQPVNGLPASSGGRTAPFI